MMEESPYFIASAVKNSNYCVTLFPTAGVLRNGVVVDIIVGMGPREVNKKIKSKDL